MTVSQPTIKIIQKEFPPDALRPLNLLHDFVELGALLLPELEMAASLSSAQDEAAHAHLLDAFLLAVGMNQILEDYLHRDVFALIKVSKNLSRLLPDPLGAWATAATKRAARACFSLRAILPGEQRLIQYQRALSAFVLQLADRVTSSLQADASETRESVQKPIEELLPSGRNLLAFAQSAPEALQHEIIRLPSCFRSFDQRPEDCQQMVEKFAARWPDRNTPLVVVGVRTSGNYLAPLYAASLRALGYQQVQAVTLRPGQMWLPGNAPGSSSRCSRKAKRCWSMTLPTAEHP